MATEGTTTGPKPSFLTSNGTREGAENRMGTLVVPESTAKRLHGAVRRTSIKRSSRQARENSSVLFGPSPFVSLHRFPLTIATITFHFLNQII